MLSTCLRLHSWGMAKPGFEQSRTAPEDPCLTILLCCLRPHLGLKCLLPGNSLPPGLLLGLWDENCYPLREGCSLHPAAPYQAFPLSIPTPAPPTLLFSAVPAYRAEAPSKQHMKFDRHGVLFREKEAKKFHQCLKGYEPLTHVGLEFFKSVHILVNWAVPRSYVTCAWTCVPWVLG